MNMSILENGYVMAKGKELDRYARSRGLCRLCGQTQTHKRAGRFLKIIRNHWEPLTVRSEQDDGYIVYKGYCIQPTCYSLEEARRNLGETVPRKSGCEMSATEASIPATILTEHKNTNIAKQRNESPVHTTAHRKWKDSSSERTQRTLSTRNSDTSTVCNVSLSKNEGNDSDSTLWPRRLDFSGSMIGGTGTGINPHVDTSIVSEHSSLLSSPNIDMPIKHILDAFVKGPYHNGHTIALSLSNIELFELNISSVITALRIKRLTTPPTNSNISTNDSNQTMFLLDTLLLDRCKISKGNRLVNFMQGLLEEGVQVSKLTLRENGLENIQGLTTYIRSDNVGHALRELNLAKNRLGDTGVSALFSALLNNNEEVRPERARKSPGLYCHEGCNQAPHRSITNLNLSHNNLMGLPGSSVRFLSISQTLTTLNLEHNCLRDDGIRLLTTAINHQPIDRNHKSAMGDFQDDSYDNKSAGSSLERLFLGHNFFGHYGAEALSDMISQNHSIITIGIEGNEIGDEGGRFILKSLNYKGLGKKTSLREISGLYTNKIADEEIIHSIEKCLIERAQLLPPQPLSSNESDHCKKLARDDEVKLLDSFTEIILNSNGQKREADTSSINDVLSLLSSQMSTDNSDSFTLASVSSTSLSDHCNEESNTFTSNFSYDGQESNGSDPALEAILPLPNIQLSTSTATGMTRPSLHRAALKAFDLESSENQIVYGSEHGLGDLQTICLSATGIEEAGFETIALVCDKAATIKRRSSRSKKERQYGKGMLRKPLLDVTDFGVEVSCGENEGEDTLPMVFIQPYTRFSLERSIEDCKAAISRIELQGASRSRKQRRIRLRKRLLELSFLRRSMLTKAELQQRISELDMALNDCKRSKDGNLRENLESDKELYQDLLEKELDAEAAHQEKIGEVPVVLTPNTANATNNANEVIVHKQRPTEHDLRLQSFGSPMNVLTIFQAAPLSYVDQNTNERNFLPFLDFDYESRVLKQSLKDAESIGTRIDIEHEIATTDRLGAFLAQGGRRLLHLSCHGHPEWLALENGFGDMQPLFVEDLKDFMKAGDINLDFVFISACHSLAAGVAFYDAGVPHVVCARKNAKFRDEACAEFARCFYRALACNRTLKQAFRMAKEAVRVSPLVKDAKIESNKFLLLPERGEDDPYHDIKISFSDSRSTLGSIYNASMSIPLSRMLPRVPHTFMGREDEVYRVLEALRCTDLVRVCGGRGTGKTTMVAAVAKYIQQRHKSFMLDDVIWLPSENMAENDQLAILLNKAISVMIEAKRPVKNLSIYKETQGRILNAIHGKRLLLVVDSRLFPSIASFQNLNQFLQELLQALSVKVLMIGNEITSMAQDGDSASFHRGSQRSKVPSRTINLGPLDFETSAYLFSRLVHSGRFSPPELANILLPKAKQKKKSEQNKPSIPYPLRRDAIIFEAIGRGIPGAIEQSAAEMSEKELFELVRIAQRPCPTVTTRAALEEEIQHRLSEEATALRKKQYLRARDLRELIDELQGLRKYLKTREELSTEAEILREQLEQATRMRNYDAASNIQQRLEALENQMAEEERFTEESMMDRFKQASIRAKKIRKMRGKAL